MLGVSDDAPDAKIKRAYRKLSLKYHPDKNPGDEAAAQEFAKYVAGNCSATARLVPHALCHLPAPYHCTHARTHRVAHAYEILSDPDKRMLYDTGGEDAVRENDMAAQAPASPFDMLFGGGGGGKKRNHKKGPDIRADIHVSLEDMYNGGEVSARIQRTVICRGCSKNPHTAKCRQCGACPPEVRIVTRQMAPGFNVQMQEEVPSKEKCKPDLTTLTAVVEKGMADGHEITFERMSEQRPGMLPGDVVFTLRQHPHARFRREGDDLHMDMHISLKEALVGFSRTVPHLDGHLVTIASDSVTKPGQVRNYKNEGMPQHDFPSHFGTLHVKFTVDFPSKLSNEQLEAIKSIL